MSFSVIEEEVLKMAKESGNHFATQYVYLVLARLRMEVGDYTEADKALEAVQAIFTEHG